MSTKADDATWAHDRVEMSKHRETSSTFHIHKPRPLGHDLPKVALEGHLLHHAFLGDQSEVKKFLLAHVDVNCRDRDCKSTPLHMAAKGNHIEVVETLLKHGADFRLQDKEGETPLHEATDSNAIHVAELLIQKGAPLDIQDEMGWTALHNAAGCGDHPEIVELLLKAGANTQLKTKLGQTALDLAVKNEHPDAEKLLRRSN